MKGRKTWGVLPPRVAMYSKVPAQEWLEERGGLDGSKGMQAALGKVGGLSCVQPAGSAFFVPSVHNDFRAVIVL